jgi:drug/metabolite transporter (DMT)-like permease
MTERRAYILLLLIIVFWAGNFPLSKLALGELGPATITGGRALIAAPLLWAIARWRTPGGRTLARRDVVAFAVLAVTGLVLNTTVWYYGLARTTALNAGILGAASPIFVAVAAALLLGDRLTRLNWLGIAVSVLAVMVTVAKGSITVLLSFTVNRGDLIILGSQWAWVSYTLYLRAASSTLPAIRIMAGAHAVGALLLVPLALVIDRPWRAVPGPIGWLVILYGVFPVTLGHLWYYDVVRSIGPGRSATFLNLMPFVVLALSWAIVGEPVRTYHVVGALLVIIGVYLATRRAD